MFMCLCYLLIVVSWLVDLYLFIVFDFLRILRRFCFFLVLMDASFVNDGNSAGGSLFVSSGKYSGGKVTEIFGLNISGGFFTDLYSCFFVPIQMRFKHMSAHKYEPPLHQDYGCPFLKGSLNYVTRCSDMRCSNSIICFHV